MQGIAPLFTGSYSDRKGRRPILMICMAIFIATSLALARQSSFAALMVLRCVQSFGSAGAFAPTFATIVDIVPRSERGKYMAYITMGSTIGSSTGPIIGGVLTNGLGWRSIFWFLAICSGTVTVLIVLFLRETCRAVVGNGSIPPPAWNRPLVHHKFQDIPDYESQTTFTTPPRVVDCLKIIWNRQVGPLIFFWSLISWAQITIEISLPVILGEKYHLRSLQVGLCYIPWATGAITARWSVGSLADWNFKRLGQKVGVAVQHNQQTNEELQKLPLEKIRLQIALPAVYMTCVFTAAYGWASVSNVHISCPLVLLFFLGNAMTGAANTISALIVDLRAYKPGTVRGGMAIFRCLPGAGVSAAINPAIASIGFGWLGTIFSGVLMLCSPILWVAYFRGQRWRTST